MALARPRARGGPPRATRGASLRAAVRPPAAPPAKTPLQSDAEFVLAAAAEAVAAHDKVGGGEEGWRSWRSGGGGARAWRGRHDPHRARRGAPASSAGPPPAAGVGRRLHPPNAHRPLSPFQLVTALNPGASARAEEALLADIENVGAALAAADEEVGGRGRRGQGAFRPRVPPRPTPSPPPSFLQVAASDAALSRTLASLETLEAAPAAAAAAPSRPAAARAGLAATLDLAPGLAQFWHPVAFSADVRARGRAVAFDLFDRTWSVTRARGGALAIASASDSALRLPVAEADGLVWAWPGTGEPPAGLPTFAATPPGYTVHAELTMDVPVDAGLLLDNLLDLAHAPFTHTTTFAKGWPVPDAVRFAASSSLAGAWDPYPIDMEHAPPTGVLSTIGLAAPGAVDRSGAATAAACARHLHQLHVVLPAGRGRVRLLYRMALDFWPWAAKVPGARALWARVAARVMGEDLVLVAGQQDRLSRGGDVWRTPAPYDKLAVRARRWRTAASAAGGPPPAGAAGGGLAMGAGELMFGSVDK